MHSKRAMNIYNFEKKYVYNLLKDLAVNGVRENQVRNFIIFNLNHKDKAILNISQLNDIMSIMNEKGEKSNE